MAKKSDLFKNTKQNESSSWIDNIKNIFSTKASKSELKDFYAELFSSYLSGDKEVPDRSLDEGTFYYTSKKIYTKYSVKKAYIINDFPPYVDERLFTRLRNTIGLYNARMNIFMVSRPYYFNPNSFAIKRRINIWKQRYDSYEEKVARRSTTEEVFKGRSEEHTDAVNERMIESWKFVQDTSKNRKELVKIRLLVEVIANDDEELDRATKEFENFLDMDGYNHNSCWLQTFEYNKRFSINSLDKGGIIEDTNPEYILNDGIISKFTSFYQGEIADKTGVIFGMDFYSKLPVSKSFAKEADAQNLLVAAETGGGKSMLIKYVLSQFMLLGYKLIIIDYEGDEYTPLGQYLGAKRISLYGDDCPYFDTTEIGDITGDPKIDASLYNDATSITKRVFDILYDIDEGMNVRQVAIFNDALNNLYGSRGVVMDDKYTWYRSRGLSFRDIYNEIIALSRNNEYKAVYGEHLQGLIDSLRVYLGDDGIKRSMFSKKLSINELKEDRFILFSFGMKGATSQTSDAKDLTLKQMTIAYLSALLANYNKTHLGVSTVIEFEELQRYLRNEVNCEEVVNVFSGSRKRNVVAIAATNDPMGLVKGTYSGSEAIMENVSTAFFGPMKSRTIDALAEHYSMDNCVDYLNKLYEDEQYKYCFLMSNNLKEFTILRVEVPEELAKTPIYATRNKFEIG